MKRLSLLLLIGAVLPALAACATTSGPIAAETERPPVAETQDARIADLAARELDRRARYDPQSLEAVAPELRALAMALADADALPALHQPAAGLAPAPEDMLDAPSLWHGIHLASYRIPANAVSGWEVLQREFPAVLGGRQARVETVSVPDRGEFLRLKAGPYDSLAAARAACAEISRAGEYCMPVDFSGRSLTDIVSVASN
tara:strand:+ start:43596 stop:44201 length:606 start_codon:yes stop_codon:yes gene_type:complete